MSDDAMPRPVVPWTRRTPAVAHMLNPAFLAGMVVAATYAYTNDTGRPMPYAYPYVIAPLLLHRQTRDALPGTARAHLSKWVENHQVLALGFPQRARELRINVDEGLRHALRNDLLIIEDGGLVASSPPRRAADLGDARAVLARATLLGRWFARVEQPATVFALLGVTP